MNRFKSLFAVALAVTAISGCRKNDWVTLPNGRDKCDYISAYSTYLSPDNDVVTPIFIKSYKPGTFKLEHLQLLRAAPIPSFEPAVEFSITYQGQNMYLVQPGNDTTQIVFDAVGKPAKAFSSFVVNGEKTESKFIYNSGGKLVEIKQRELETGNTAWFSFAKITYDGPKKNVTKIEFRSGSASQEIHTFTYDYSKKPKRQYYADQVTASGVGFWPLLTTLNLFPELEPTNQMTAWHYNAGADSYPPSIDAIYTNHQYDGNGKLVSYSAQTTVFSQITTAPWTINWSCLDKK